MTTNKHAPKRSTFVWRDLHEAGYTFNSPFQLTLMTGEYVQADEVLRIVPGKRMVVFGQWQGKPAVAKLFYDGHQAKRHIEKDIAGIRILQDSKVPTPAVLYQGISEDRRVHILIFERIDNGESLQSLWLTRESDEMVLPDMQAVMIELATQHVLGVLQHDLHLNNFLMTEKRIYTLDGGQVERLDYLLPKKQSVNSLSLLLSQLGAGMEAYQENLFNYYCKSRGWRIKRADTVELFACIKKWNQQRWEKFEKKIFRNSSDFALLKTWRMWGVYTRRDALPELMQVLKDPETAFQHPSAILLKGGRSATVIKVNLDGRSLVVKRYNMKDKWHWLRRCLRPTRAVKSWRLAQKFVFSGIRTARPIAFIERRFLGLRSQSYYITAYVSATNTQDFFKQHVADKTKVANMVKQIAILLKNIAKLNVTHGDLKATNLLIDEHDEPVLIDLDGAYEHNSPSTLRHAWRKEIKRFMENFDAMPELQTAFRKVLDQ